MARREQVVVLRVAYDDTEASPPETWDWHDLIDCPREDVGILLTGDLIERTET